MILRQGLIFKQIYGQFLTMDIRDNDILATFNYCTVGRQYRAEPDKLGLKWTPYRRDLSCLFVFFKRRMSGEKYR